ncbi:hypothetical protein WJX84_007177 [Apatococcus fuscideae]|uniref:Uncharacterized protein n=1 Tax=Apatococcus fuscideae TaxID=2026836 RepID=A0AAW1SRB3_9CHLO
MSNPRVSGTPAGVEEECSGASHLAGLGVVAAAIENRAKEVGLAILDLSRMSLKLLQYVETSRSYSLTTSMLSIYEPREVVTIASSSSLTGLLQAMSQFSQVAVGRQLFDDTKGAELVLRLATVKGRLQDGSTSSLYLAFGAAGALVRHLEDSQYIFSAHSLHIDICGTSKHMQVDTDAISMLEVIEPLQPSVSSKEKTSLFRLMNSCKTRCGAQMLRANLIQPLLDISTIDMRLNSLDELVGDEDLAYGVQQCLSRLPKDLDRCCQ